MCADSVLIRFPPYFSPNQQPLSKLALALLIF